MKVALVDGVRVQADADAPERATCPPGCDCGGGKPVELRFLTRNGARHWYYRHRASPVDELPSRIEHVCGDPLVTMMVDSVEQGIEAARRGDLKAILSLAFSPLVHMTLNRVDVAPEELLATVLPEPSGAPATVLVTDDAEEVQQVLTERRGPPVFDLHPERDRPQDLLDSAWYVPLFEPWRSQARRVGFILEQAERVYVLGRREEWERIAARL